jgi:hypothetical protein
MKTFDGSGKNTLYTSGCVHKFLSGRVPLQLLHELDVAAEHIFAIQRPKQLVECAGEMYPGPCSFPYIDKARLGKFLDDLRSPEKKQGRLSMEDSVEGKRPLWVIMTQVVLCWHAITREVGHQSGCQQLGLLERRIAKDTSPR